MAMIKLGLGAILAGLLVTCAMGQVTVEVVLDQEQFLPSEPIWAAVRVTNRSGQKLRLGQDNDWLAISVEGRDNFLVAKTDDIPVKGEFTLESSQIATKRLNLSPYFNLMRPGRYAIIATVRVNEWDKEFASPPKSFDIIDGRKLWEQEFGVPRACGSPEVRKYALQQAIYLKQLKLYVRVSDATDAKIYRVFPLGPMVSFGRPVPQVDKSSRLHVLFQTGARKFLYCVISPDGELVQRLTYEYWGQQRPRLAMDEEGNVIVTGGIRRVALDDIVPSEQQPATNRAVATP